MTEVDYYEDSQRVSSTGSAHALPMTDEEKEAANKRDRIPFGFRAPEKKEPEE